MTFSIKFFVSFDFRNGISKYYLVTLPIFDMFHPQTTDIQPFKRECFSTKTLKFQQYHVNIYDVTADFGILFGVWIGLVTSYPCAKFQYDMTINNGIYCVFHVLCFMYF